jgi:hypothetical protein
MLGIVYYLRYKLYTQVFINKLRNTVYGLCQIYLRIVTRYGLEMLHVIFQFISHDTEEITSVNIDVDISRSLFKDFYSNLIDFGLNIGSMFGNT